MSTQAQLIEQGLTLTEPQREAHDAHHGLTAQHYLAHPPHGITHAEMIHFLTGHIPSVATFTEAWAYAPLPAVAMYLTRGYLSADSKFHLEAAVNAYNLAVRNSTGRSNYLGPAEPSFLDTEVRRECLPLLLPQPRPGAPAPRSAAVPRSDECIVATMSWVFGRPCTPHDVAYLRANCPPLYGYVAVRAQALMYHALTDSLRRSGRQWLHWVVDLLGSVVHQAGEESAATTVGSKRRRLEEAPAPRGVGVAEDAQFAVHPFDFYAMQRCITEAEVTPSSTS
ncbi:uncharacterized protein LOC62_03G005168 [Vanrija pseudolonga]|uniref:Uncharacterized protein n=1 Tax=Vanrija pseudolonga TaxID=143232 RepID=A0AAF1BL12_9TREE|nr:hypothetical protein LOC62_03G005168 [Vanrija pseudolonga]